MKLFAMLRIHYETSCSSVLIKTILLVSQYAAHCIQHFIISRTAVNDAENCRWQIALHSPNMGQASFVRHLASPLIITSFEMLFFFPVEQKE